MEIANNEFGPVVRLIARTSLGNVSRVSVGARLGSRTEDIPGIAMAPPDTDSSDGTRLSVSLTSAIAVDYVAVHFIFLDGPCMCVVWMGNDRGSTCGCNWHNVARSRCSRCARLGSHELICLGLCAQFLVECTGEALDLSLTIGPSCGQRRPASSFRNIPGEIDAWDATYSHSIVARFGGLGHCGIVGLQVTAGRPRVSPSRCYHTRDKQDLGEGRSGEMRGGQSADRTVKGTPNRWLGYLPCSNTRETLTKCVVACDGNGGCPKRRQSLVRIRSLPCTCVFVPTALNLPWMVYNMIATVVNVTDLSGQRLLLLDDCSALRCSP